MEVFFQLESILVINMKSNLTKYMREPVNALTHLFGAGLFFILTIFMYVKVFQVGATWKLLVSVTAFGIGLISLYLTSGWYHSIYTSEENLEFWKKMDHTMIFILIAGSYTPFCLLSLPENLGYPLLAVIWLIAIVGSLMMIFWINMPRWLNTGLYILMGWVGLTCFVPLYHSLAPGCFYLLILGGVFYTIGGIIYGVEKPNLHESFGFHELFHVFCILGSLCHYFAVYNYLIK